MCLPQSNSSRSASISLERLWAMAPNSLLVSQQRDHKSRTALGNESKENCHRCQTSSPSSEPDQALDFLEPTLSIPWWLLWDLDEFGLLLETADRHYAVGLKGFLVRDSGQYGREGKLTVTMAAGALPGPNDRFVHFLEERQGTGIYKLTNFMADISNTIPNGTPGICQVFLELSALASSSALPWVTERTRKANRWLIIPRHLHLQSLRLHLPWGLFPSGPWGHFWQVVLPTPWTHLVCQQWQCIGNGFPCWGYGMLVLCKAMKKQKWNVAFDFSSWSILPCLQGICFHLLVFLDNGFVGFGPINIAMTANKTFMKGLIWC